MAGNLSSLPRTYSAGGSAEAMSERDPPQPRHRQPQQSGAPQQKALPRGRRRSQDQLASSQVRPADDPPTHGDAAPSAIIRGGSLFVREDTAASQLENPALPPPPWRGDEVGAETKRLRQQLTTTQLQLSEANNKLRAAQQAPILPSPSANQLNRCGLVLSPSGTPWRGERFEGRPPEPAHTAPIRRPSCYQLAGGAP